MDARHVTPADDFDPLATDDPAAVYAEFERMRREVPVARTSAYGGYWALTRYADVRDAAADSQLFISSVRAVVPSDPRGLRRPPLNFDAPRHTPYRRALDRTLQRARIERLEPALRTHARRELRPLLEAGEGDFASGFGSIFPAWVTAEWLNLDPGIAPVLARTAAEWVDGWRRQDGDLVTARSEQMYDIARRLVADRASAPRAVDDDPASSLLAERDEEGGGLDPDQIVAALRQSLVVGMVAPPILLGAIVLHLARDRTLQDRLRADPALIPAAIEEFVRLYSPYRGFARTVSRSVEIGGRRIEPGEPVTLAYAAANRDPAMFESPAEFRLDRENIAQHLGFGRGRHACVGMPLARLSLQIAVGELLAATSWFDADEPPGTGARMPEVGPTTVTIRLAPAGDASGAAERGTLEAP